MREFQPMNSDSALWSVCWSVLANTLKVPNISQDDNILNFNFSGFAKALRDAAEPVDGSAISEKLSQLIRSSKVADAYSALSKTAWLLNEGVHQQSSHLLELIDQFLNETRFLQNQLVTDNANATELRNAVFAIVGDEQSFLLALADLCDAVHIRVVRATEAIEKGDMETFSNVLEEQYTIPNEFERHWKNYQREHCNSGYVAPSLSLPKPEFLAKNFYLDQKYRNALMASAIKDRRVDVMDQLLLFLEKKSHESYNSYSNGCGYYKILMTSAIQHYRADVVERLLLSSVFSPLSCDLKDLFIQAVRPLEEESEPKPKPEFDIDLTSSSSTLQAIGALNAETLKNTGFATRIASLLSGSTESEINACIIIRLLVQHTIKHNVVIDLKTILAPCSFLGKQKDFFIKVSQLPYYLRDLRNNLSRYGRYDGWDYGYTTSSEAKRTKIVAPLLESIKNADHAFRALVANNDDATSSAAEKLNEIIGKVVSALHKAQFDNTALANNTVKAKLGTVYAFFSAVSSSQAPDHGGFLGVLLNAQLAKLKETFPDYFKTAQKEITKRDLRR